MSLNASLRSSSLSRNSAKSAQSRRVFPFTRRSEKFMTPMSDTKSLASSSSLHRRFGSSFSGVSGLSNLSFDRSTVRDLFGKDETNFTLQELYDKRDLIHNQVEYIENNYIFNENVEEEDPLIQEMNEMLESLDIENNEKYKSMKDKNIQKLKKCIEKIDEMIAKKLEGESKATETGNSLCMKLALNIEEIHKYAKQIKSNNIEDDSENDILFIQNFLWAGLRAMKDALSEICRPELIVTPSEYYLSNFYYVPDYLPAGDNIEKMNNPEDLFSALESLVSSMQENYINNNNNIDTDGETIQLEKQQQQQIGSTTVITSSSKTSRIVKSSYVKTEETVTEIKEEEEQSKEQSKEEENDNDDKEKEKEEKENKKDDDEDEDDEKDKSIPSIATTPIPAEALTSSPIPNDTSLLNDTINSETNQLDNNNNINNDNQLVPSLSSDLVLLSQLVDKLHEVFMNQIQTPRTETGTAASVPSLSGSEVKMDKSFVSSSTTTTPQPPPPLLTAETANVLNKNNNSVTQSDTSSSYIIPNNSRFQPHFYHTYHEQKELHGELMEYKKKLEGSSQRIDDLSDTVVDMKQRILNTKQRQAEDVDGLSPPFNEISDSYDHTKKDMEELRNNTDKIFALERKYSDILSKYNDMNSKYKELNDRYNLQKQLYQTIKGQLQYVYPAVQQTLCMPDPLPLQLGNIGDEEKVIIDSRSMKELEQFKHDLSQFIENSQKQYDLLMQCKKPYGILWRYVTNNYQISIGKIHGLCDSLMNAVISAIDNNNNEDDIFGDIDESDMNDTKLIGNYSSITSTPGNPADNTANTPSTNTNTTTNTTDSPGNNTSTAIAAQTRAERLNSLKFYLDVLLNGIEQLSDTDSGNIYVGDLMERSFNILFNNAVDYENVIMKLKADFDALKLKSAENEKKTIQLQKMLEQYGYLK